MVVYTTIRPPPLGSIFCQAPTAHGYLPGRLLRARRACTSAQQTYSSVSSLPTGERSGLRRRAPETLLILQIWLGRSEWLGKPDSSANSHKAKLSGSSIPPPHSLP